MEAPDPDCSTRSSIIITLHPFSPYPKLPPHPSPSPNRTLYTVHPHFPTIRVGPSSSPLIRLARRQGISEHRIARHLQAALSARQCELEGEGPVRRVSSSELV